jgi:hypothetical protein
MSFLDKVKILRKDSKNTPESDSLIGIVCPTYTHREKTISEAQVQELVVKIPGLERRLNDIEETLNKLIEGLNEQR